jgi:hypothetical protein
VTCSVPPIGRRWRLHCQGRYPVASRDLTPAG